MQNQMWLLVFLKSKKSSNKAPYLHSYQKVTY